MENEHLSLFFVSAYTDCNPKNETLSAACNTLWADSYVKDPGWIFQENPTDMIRCTHSTRQTLTTQNTWNNKSIIISQSYSVSCTSLFLWISLNASHSDVFFSFFKKYIPLGVMACIHVIRYLETFSFIGTIVHLNVFLESFLVRNKPGTCLLLGWNS